MGKYLTGWPASRHSTREPGSRTSSPRPASGSSHSKEAGAVPAPSLLYDLLAVVNHSGSMAQGHYTAFVKEVGRWFRFDDTWVREVDEEEVLASEAYILFYFQRGADAAWRPSPSSPMETGVFASTPSPANGLDRSQRPHMAVGKRRL